MIHITYKLASSLFHGIGLFADQPVAKGALIYTASPLLDVNITTETFNRLSNREQDEIRYWGFWMEEEKRWHVDFDVSKFINHSPEPTVTQHPDHNDAYLVATRDIAAGEELTQNYLEFESADDLRKRGINT